MSKTKQREIDLILDEMEDRRETYQERARIPQYDGFRKQWSEYISDCIENLYQ